MKDEEYFKKNKVKLTSEQLLKIQIGGLITYIRLHKGLTQAQLARKIGTKQPAIARIENNRYIPSLKVLNKIADKCGYKLSITLQANK